MADLSQARRQGERLGGSLGVGRTAAQQTARARLESKKGTTENSMTEIQAELDSAIATARHALEEFNAALIPFLELEVISTTLLNTQMLSE
jgi:hypothetical protein